MAKPRSTKRSGVIAPVGIPPQPTNPRDVQSVYCNVMGMTASSLDVRLLFSEIINTGGPEISVELRANVVMSLPHFRAMVGVFVQQLGVLDEALKQAGPVER